MAKKTFASTIIAPILNGISSIFGKDDDEEEKKKKEEEERKQAQGKATVPAPVKKTYTIADSSPLAPVAKNAQIKSAKKSTKKTAPIAEYSATSPMNDMQWRTDTVPGMTETIKDNIQPTFFKEGSGSVIDKILGTAVDAAENVASGFMSFGESAVDSLLTLGSNLGKANLAQANFNMTYSPYAATKKGREMASGIVATNNALQKKSDETVSNVINNDLINEQQIAQKYITKPFEEKMGINAQKASVIGEMGAKTLQSAGQLATQNGLTALGVPPSLSIGLSSFGGEMENALKQGATLEEATVSSMISATGEILFERLSGGIKLGGKTLDEKILDPFIDKISNDVVRKIVNIGADAFGEGLEEIFSGVISNFGSALYKEESIGTLINSEEARKEYVESFLIGSLLGGTSSTAKATINTVSDLVREKKENKLTSNEQRVVDTEIESRMKELEDSGEKVKRSKVHKEVMKDLEEGLISIDTIESALGGETYKRYKEAVDNEVAVKDEFDILNKMKQGDMTGEQSDRRNELKKQLEEMNNSTVTAELKKQLGDEVFNISKSTRLEESYREAERGKQAFNVDLSKYDEKQQTIVKAAIESGVLNNTNKSHRFVDFVAKISADKGITFDFTNNKKLQDSVFAVEGREVSGYVVRGNVTVNVSSKRMLNSIVGHEIMHVFKGTDLYAPLTEALTAYSKSKGEYNSRLENTTKLYEGMDADINEELFADMVGDYIFADEDFVRRLSTENRNVFQKVYDEIKYLCKTATTASDEGRQLLKEKHIFEKMYREEVDIKNTTDEGGVKYSISETTDGRIVAVVDSDILDKIDTTSWDKNKKETAKKAAVSALKQFSDGIVVKGITRKVNRDSRREYTRSEDTERLYYNSPDIFADKMRAADVADDIVIATTDWNRDGYLKHPRNDNFVDFEHGTTLIACGNAKYSAEVVVGISKNGEAYFYDVIDMTPANFDIKKVESPTTATTQNTIGDINGDSTNDILTQKNEKSSVNDVFGFEINKDADVNEDLLEDISYYHPDAEIDVEGNITVYHRTSKANAEKIKQTGIMSAKEDALFFSSKESGYASDYGDTVLKFKIPSTELRINDVFDGEVHLDLPLEYRNGGYRLDVSEYLVKDNNADYSLSAPVRTETKRRARDIYGDDVSLDTSENIAPIREDVKKADSAEPVRAAVTEQKKIAPVKEDLKASDKEKKFTTLDIIDDDIETEVKSEEVKVKSEDVSSKPVTIKDKALDNIAKTVRKALSLTPAEKKTAAEIVQRYAESGKRDTAALAEELKSSFAERSYKERVEEIADVKHALKSFKIFVPQNIKNGITDYSDFRRRNFGKLTLSNEGTSVDKVYEALSYSFPNFFPADVENDIDRLLQMSEVAGMETYKDGVDFLSDESITETAELIDDVVNTHKEKSFAEEAERLEREQNRPMKRSEYHGKIIEDFKSTFAKRGFNLDEVLAKAKNMSTLRINDNTPQRVMKKTFGPEEGDILADLTVNKVAQNESEGIKWLNSFLDKKSGLLAKISKQYGIKPGSDESAAAQMYAEGFYVNDLDEIVEYGDKELMQDFKDPQVRQKIKDLAGDERIRKIYDETLEAINESRRRNLYPEIPRLDNYFLHFREMGDTFSRIGVPLNTDVIRADNLPTNINGQTIDLKPGQPYFASAKHREGKRTTFDLLGGLEKYLTSAKNQIYHIDDIQNLRALRNYIAETYGEAQGVRNLDTLSEEQIHTVISENYNKHLSNFAMFLSEEANHIAGKKPLIDRGSEGWLGRVTYPLLNALNKQFSNNVLGLNIGTPLTNFLSVAQAFAKTNKFDFFKGFTQTVTNKLKSLNGTNDDFAENSPVIIRRKGAEQFYRKPYEKITDAGYFLMGLTDDISTEIIARAKYNELTRKGMDSQKAHFETDKWVSALMGDRSLGQMPLMYNSKVLGQLTKFQLEVRNQLDSMFYDTIQEAKLSNKEIENKLERNAKTAAKITSTLFQLAVAQHVFGQCFEQIAGYNPAFDIIEVIATALGLDDEEDDEDTVLDNIEEAFFALLEDLPYTSIVTGGRLPLSNMLPVQEFVTGKDEYGNEKSRLKTLMETAPYYLFPMGYGQLKKTAKGLQMFSDKHPISGSYTDSGNLRFPVDKTPGNVLQAAVFGQYANENAREYFDEGYAPLKEKQIQEFIDVDMPISDYRKYREGLSGLETLNEKGDYIGGLKLPVSKKNILINNIADRDEPIDMTDYKKYKGFEEFDFAQREPETYKVLEEQGISVKDYKENYEKKVMINTDDFSWASDNPDKYAVSKAVASDVLEYKKYTSELSKFEADKDKNGESINGTKKKKQKEYIFSLPLEYGQKIILYRSLFNSKEDKRTYNNDIIDYLESREDLSYEDKVAILTELDFTVDENGYVKW